jgi:FAD/FMN-containing dehydrogenase
MIGSNPTTGYNFAPLEPSWSSRIVKLDRRSFVNATLMGAAGALLPVARTWADTGGADAASAGLAAHTGSGRAISLSGSDLKDFDASLRGELVRAGDVGYDAARRLWNPAFDHHPALIARCSGAADVMQAVQFARSHDLLTAVRGGGHSISGQSGCDGGLVIDLSAMRGVWVDAPQRRAQAQGGVRLGDLDQETQLFGLATTLGTAPDTGIAGLTLGGGFGRLNRTFGLACDNLRAVEIVTADGKLLQASAEENPDLFWAVRGGGGNFGVVTSFEYTLHPLGPKVLAGFRAFPYQQARSVLTALTEFAHSMPDQLYIEVQVGRSAALPPPGLYVGYEAVYSGSPSEGERLLAPLEKLGKPLYDDLTLKTYVAAQGGAGKANPAPHETSNYWKSGFIAGLPANLADELVQRFESAPAIIEAVLLFRLGGAIERVSPDATAFWNRRIDYDMLLMASWKDLSRNDENVALARTFWEGLEPFTRNYYINTDVAGGEQRLRATYGGNYPRLVKLKDRYDPTNLFRLNANIKPSAQG